MVCTAPASATPSAMQATRERQARAIAGERSRAAARGRRRAFMRRRAAGRRAAARDRRTAAASGECVTISAAAPERFTSPRRQSSTLRALASSRLPVGSSASSRRGRVDQRARDRGALRLAAGERAGLALRRGSRAPPLRALPRARRPRSSRATPFSASGSATFSATDEVGQQVERLEDEAHVPAPPECERIVVAEVEGRAVDAHRAARRAGRGPRSTLRSVDLPEPDSPTIATSSPARDVEVDRVEERRRDRRTSRGRGPRARAMRSASPTAR